MRGAFLISYAAANLGLIGYGLLLLLAPGTLLATAEAIPAGLPEASAAGGYLAGLVRLLGYLNLVLGTMGVLLLLGLRSGAPRRLVRILVVSTNLAYLGPIVFDNTVGVVGPFEVVELALFAATLTTGILSWGRIADTVGS